MSWSYITEEDRREIFNIAQDWSNASRKGDTEAALIWRQALGVKLNRLVRT